MYQKGEKDRKRLKDRRGKKNLEPLYLGEEKKETKTEGPLK